MKKIFLGLFLLVGCSGKVHQSVDDILYEEMLHLKKLSPPEDGYELCASFPVKDEPNYIVKICREK